MAERVDIVKTVVDKASLNRVLDTSFTVNWKDYQNCILLTHSGDLKKLDTKIYRIITI